MQVYFKPTRPNMRVKPFRYLFSQIMESLHQMDTTEVIEAYNESNQINIISSGQFRGNNLLQWLKL